MNSNTSGISAKWSRGKHKRQLTLKLIDMKLTRVNKLIECFVTIFWSKILLSSVGNDSLLSLQLTLAMVSGFVIAWLPFATLSIWETFYPPLEIPSGKYSELP